MIRPALALTLVGLLIAAALAPAATATAATTTTTTATTTATAGAAPRARASLTDIEDEVMCVECRESLAAAQSLQANAERNYIRSLIARGLTKRQIEQNLVGQYGEAVLARPPASGFNLSVYILPPAILLAGLVILGVTLPRWRRRTRAARRAAPASPPALAPAEAARLEHELTEFRG